MTNISAVLIVTNEEKKLKACLEALSWTDEIILVDGGSKDETVEVARKFTTKIFSRSLDNFSNQKNFAIEKASCDWILSVDADEIVSPELSKNLQGIAKNGTDCSGFYLNRVNYIFGKRLRFGGHGNEKILRFFQKKKGRFVQPIHERIAVEGQTGVVSGDLLHFSTSTLEDYIKKLDLYTEFEAKWLKERKIQPTSFDLLLKPSVRFIKGYFIQLGFLDGYEGFLYHSLSSFYDFLKYARVREMTSLE